MSKLTKINLKMFGNEKDFFTNAFDEAYNITEGTPEVVEEPESVPTTEDVQTQDEVHQEPEKPAQEPRELSDDEIREMYESKFGKPQETEHEVDEETQSALELYKYLSENSHLVQAMREYDAQGYKQLNQFVPDEITRELNELKEFKAELEYKAYISDLKSKYNDFDEDKVLQYAEKVDIVDLDVAYKAMKAESMETPNVDELREQIKKELLEELKNNSIQTQTLVGSGTQKPINNNEQVNLTSREQRIAKAMGLTPTEYDKWR